MIATDGDRNLQYNLPYRPNEETDFDLKEPE